jgi:hypothetical protein
MPLPKKGESRNSYLKRAIPEVKKDSPGLSQKAVIGKSEGMYDYYTKKGGKK